MLVMNALPKPSVSLDPSMFRPNIRGVTFTLPRINVGPVRDPLADTKRDFGNAIRAFLDGLRASMPVLHRRARP